MRAIAAALAAALLATVARAVPPAVVDWRDASGHVGEVVTIEGDVVSTATTPDTVTLEFSPDAKAFHAVLLIPLLTDLPPHPERLYAGKHVRVSGRVERFRGRPEMVLRSPGAIEVVNVATAQTDTPSAAVAPSLVPAVAAPRSPATVATSPIAPPPSPPPTPPAPPSPPSTAPPPPSPPPTVPAPQTAAPPSPVVEAAPRAVPQAAAQAAPQAVPQAAAIDRPAPAPLAAAPPPTELPPAPEPRGLVEAVQRRVGALDGCERARSRWRDAGATARAGAGELTRCLDGGGYDCRAAAAALAPALSSLEGAAQQVERACP